MHIRVRLFALLRERAGADEVELELPEGALVRDALAQVSPLTDGVAVVLAVNRRYADL
jgi:MoaE-MoaD fusion protein